MTLILISDNLMHLHAMSPGHIESPQRINAIRQAISQSHISNHIEHHQSNPADLNIIKLVHSKPYINALINHTPETGYSYLPQSFCSNPESVPLGPNTYQTALHAVGSVISAIDLIAEQKAKRIFCLTRPPGHHAEKSKAIGYCYFNNLAICALYAIKKMCVKKIAIVDFDAHHGNGIESILQKREDILYISSYQYPYKNYEEQPSDKNCIRLHLNAHAKGDEFRSVWSNIGLKAINAYKPELILVAAGFDGHYMDPMSDLLLDDQDFNWLGNQLIELADRYSNGAILNVLEGGYNLNFLGQSVVSYLNPFI